MVSSFGRHASRNIRIAVGVSWYGDNLKKVWSSVECDEYQEGAW